MKFNYILLVLFTLGIGCSHKSNPAQVSLVAKWNSGESHNFYLTKVKQEWQDEVLYTNDSVSYYFEFKVLDQTDSLYKIRIKYYYEVQLPDSKILHEPMLTDIFYSTRWTGEFKELGNREYVSDFLVKGFIEKIRDSENNDSLKTEKTIQLLKPVIDLYNSQEGIVGTVFKEIQLLHSFMGTTFSTSDSTDFEQYIPSPLGKDSIKTTGKLSFESFDSSKNLASFKSETTINSENLKKFIEKASAAKGTLQKTDADIVLSDQQRFEYFLDKGIPKNIEHIRQIEVSQNSSKRVKIEKMKIELVN